MHRLVVAAAFAIALAACGGDAASGIPIGPGTTTPTPATTLPGEAPEGPLTGIEATLLVSGLNQPVQVTAPPGSDRLFVVEQPGRIVVVEDGVVRPEPFLDVSNDVGSQGTEQGLLGLAFHPRFAQNGRVFVSLVNKLGDSRILEYRVDGDDPYRLDPLSRAIVLAVDQPHHFHNGGMIQFGPDGYLWLGLGDGGGIGDPFHNGQNEDVVFGGLLRLDVDAASPYAIPPDNPHAAGGGAPEKWVYGLRNPWRFTIDAPSGLVYIGDVGQDFWEEINVISLADGAGTNFGWPIAEADTCFITAQDLRDGKPVPVCDPADFALPVLVIEHVPECAVIAGPVYHGRAMPELDGTFFYSDYCAGWVRSLELIDGDVGDERQWLDGLGNVTSFGLDPEGEMLVATLGGDVLRLEPVRAGAVSP
ncbi:MAG TPA: PQQ-dependent sugar dehydrogenase [Acidimicrobiia bacterium]